MEKVILTKEQAEAIEKLKEHKEPLSLIVATEAVYRFENPEIYKINLDDIAKAIIVGYEIGNSYKKGDKVLFQVGESIPFVATLQNRVFHSKDEWSTDEAIGHISEQYFRHATAEEIYWIGELGREKVADFRMGDVYKLGGGKNKTVDLGTKIDLLKHSYHIGNLIGIYPAESFKPFPEVSKS